MLNLGTLIALAAAAANLPMAVLHGAIARAPDWRIARLFAAIALTAGLYNVLDSLYCIDGLSVEAYLLAGRLSYLMGTIQCVLWLVYAYSDGNGSLGTAPRWVRWVALSSVAAGVFFAATGWLLTSRVSPVGIPWAGVTYHYPGTTSLGDVYGFLLLALPVVAVFRMVQRFRRGERFLGWEVGLVVVFILFGVEEVLVANRILNSPSLADFGFLLLVVPLSFQVVDRVIKDARKLRDLTERLETEVRHRTDERDQIRQALIEAESNVTDLVASLDAIVWEADASTLEVTFISEGATRLLGRPDDQSAHPAAFWRRHVHPEDRERVLASMREAVRSNRKFALEYRLLAEDGRILWVRDYIHPVGPKDNPNRLRGIVVDVTESRHAHEALIESEQRFRNIADTCPVIIWNGTPDRQISFLNKEAATFTGRELDDLLGSGWVEHVHPDDLARLGSTLGSAAAGHHGFQTEFRLRRHDGEYRWVLDTAIPRFVGSEYAGHTGIVIDITDLKRNQEQVLAIQKLESLGVLSSGIAHDFNNMLGSILAESELMLAELPAGVPTAKGVSRIKAVAVRAAEIVGQLLAYAGQEGTTFEPVDLSLLVGEMLELLKVSIAKGAVLNTNLVEGLPKVRANASEMRRVLMNLVTNASEALGDFGGEITVTTAWESSGPNSVVKCGADGEGRGCVRLEVVDTGCGISEEIQARIFDPFFTTKFAGRGLGLAAVHGIVRSHGGVIKVASAPGQGTRIEVWLPCASEPAGCPDDAAVPNFAETDEPAGGTLLFVEDEDTLRIPTSKLLRKKGFSVLEADSGIAALELFRSNQSGVSLVLLDLTLPGMGGKDVFTELRRIRPDIKVILTSAYNEEMAVNAVGGHSDWVFIRKPYRIADLVKLLRNVVSA